MAEPDLFVVCKNCGSEVSPYVTECPYCGQRVRKRAPKIDKEGATEEPRRRARASRLPRLRSDEIPGIAPEIRPYGTIALIVACLVLAAVLGVQPLLGIDLGLYGPVDGEWWRLAVTPFLHDNFGYLFITMLATAIFGIHLERRFGRLAPIVVFVACGAAGAAVCLAAGSFPAVGANGAALGLLVAWLVDDRRAYRRGDDRGNDLIGVYVIAAVLVLVSVAEPDANPLAAVGGAVAGAVLGGALTLTRR
jgi:membrane associated rhomboid family serine protease